MRRVWIVVVIIVLAAVLYQLVASMIFAMDFARSVVPGWHTTIYPSWLTGAIFISMLMIVLMTIRLVRIMFKKNK